MSDMEDRRAPSAKLLALEGLEGVRLVLKGLSDETEKIGVAAASLQQGIEDRLRAAGLRVLTQEEWQKAPGRPGLHLLIGLMKHKKGFIIYAVQSELRQDVWLARNPRLTAHGVTWEGPRWFGVVNDESLAGTIQGAVNATLVDFLNAYRAANRAE